MLKIVSCKGHSPQSTPTAPSYCLSSVGLLTAMVSVIVSLSGCTKPEEQVKTDKPAPEGTTYAAAEDMELKKARVEALAHFDEFATAFKNRKEGEKFAVKAAFKDGDQEVHKWLIVDQMENLDIVGHFASGDEKGNLKAGQQATAKATFIDDWSYVDKNGGEHGGYGLSVLRKRQAK